MIRSFQRFEIKFIITKEQRQALMPELLERMVYDDYCQGGRSYRINNLYFDTDTDDLIRISTERPYYKEKVRLRWYQEGDLSFLELKKKVGGIVTKRRISLNPGEQARFLLTGGLPERTEYLDRQIGRELGRMFEEYELEGKVLIHYDRTALFDSGDSGLRITFDEHLRGSRLGGAWTALLPEGMSILEVKGLNNVPLWLSSLLSRHGIYKQRFSKYGREYGLLKEETRKKVV